MNGRPMVLAGAAAGAAFALAGALMWLVLREPATLAQAVGEGDYMPAARALATALMAWWRAILRYL
jgi:ABC-type Fe3+-siderophore transport system permease subunit